MSDIFAIKYNNSYYDFTTDIKKVEKYLDNKMISVVKVEIIDDVNGKYYQLIDDKKLFITDIFPLIKDKQYKKVNVKEI